MRTVTIPLYIFSDEELLALADKLTDVAETLCNEQDMRDEISLAGILTNEFKQRTGAWSMENGQFKQIKPPTR